MMHGFPPPVKIITNINTAMLPSDLYDILVTAWKLKSADAGGIEIKADADFRHKDTTLIFQMKHAGQPTKPFGRYTITRGQLEDMRKEHDTRNIFKSIRSQNETVDKSKWIGFISNKSWMNCHLITFKSNDIKEIIDTMSKADIPIINTSISSFIVNPDNPRIEKGERVILQHDGQAFSAHRPDASIPAIVGFAKEEMTAGNLIAIDVTATDYEFRRAGPTSGNRPKIEEPTIEIKEPLTKIIKPKIKKIVKISSIDAIRKKLRR